MPIYSAFQSGGLKLDWPYDVNNKDIINLVLKPATWASNTVYEARYDDDRDVVLPSTYKGLYARVKYPGKSSSTDPFTGTYKDGDEVTDGTLTWEMKNYNLLPVVYDILTSVNTPVTGVTLSNQSVTGGIITYKVTLTDATLKTFEVTSHVTTTGLNPLELDVTVKFKTGKR